MRNHIASQIKPSAPEKTNAQRQPSSNAMIGMTTAATAPPTLEPLSNIATASPRSSRGNQSATALLAPGQFKPSPRPSRNRKDANPNAEVANPLRLLISDQKTTASANPSRVPMASRRIPPGSHVIA